MWNTDRSEEKKPQNLTSEGLLTPPENVSLDVCFLDTEYQYLDGDFCECFCHTYSKLILSDFPFYSLNRFYSSTRVQEEKVHFRC